jgi:nitroreductase
MIAICMARQPHPNKLMPLWEELAACACAVQNMHLMATILGLAAYWSSWHDEARDSPQMLQFLGMDAAKGDRWVRCLQQVALSAFKKFSELQEPVLRVHAC